MEEHYLNDKELAILEEIASFAGSFLLVSIDSFILGEIELDSLVGLQPAGVFFTKKCVSNLQELSNLINLLKERIPSKKLIFAVEAENVIEDFSIQLKSLQTFKEMGINLLLGPSLNRYKHSEQEISKLVEIVAELSEMGMHCCPGNFPGIPSLLEDEQSAHPIVEEDLPSILEKDVPAFTQLFAKGLVGLLSSNALYPNIDTLYPGSLSEEISSTLLRDQYKFKGVVICDDVNSSAISGIFEKPYTIGRGFNAGCDLFLVSLKGQLSPTELANRLVPSIKMEKTSIERVLNSKARIEKLIEKLP